MNVEQLIKNHKNPDLIRNVLCDRASRNLKDILRKADKQLAETRKVINKDECVGVLVILNERSDFHDQDFVYQEISRLLHKKDEQGDLERKIYRLYGIFRNIKKIIRKMLFPIFLWVLQLILTQLNL